MSHNRHPLARAAAARPDHPLLVTPTRAWSAEELRCAVASAAGGLLQAGARPGDRIALIGDMDDDWVVALHAVRWMGATAVPLPSDVPPMQMRDMLQATKPTVLLSTLPVPDVDKTTLAMSIRGPEAGEHFAADCDVQLIVLTSGTTGTPKTVSLRVGQLRASAMASAQRLGHATDDAWLCCLPGHHIGGLSVLLRTLQYGTTAVVHSGFNPGAVAAAMDQGTVSQASLVPSMLTRVLDARQECAMPRTVRTILVGGAAMPDALLSRCRRLRLPVALTWGMTEVGSQAATRAPGDLRPDPDCGPPLPGVEVHVQQGRLVIVGPIAPEGRFVTEDLGRLDDEGRVIVQGRGHQLIVSGGENIDPIEIENALCSHPGVREAIVVGRPDTRWGQRPVAFVVARAQEVPFHELRAHLNQQLQRFKIPDAFRWCDALPRGPLGKILRSRLADEAHSMRSIDEG